MTCKSKWHNIIKSTFSRCPECGVSGYSHSDITQKIEEDKAGLNYGAYFRLNGSPVCIAAFASAEDRNAFLNITDHAGEIYFAGNIGETE